MTNDFDTEWNGERCWELVEARLEQSYTDAICEMAKIITHLRSDDVYMGKSLMGRLRKRVINGSYAHDFGYWRRGADAPIYALTNDVEEEILDAIVYMAIRRWIEDERAFDSLVPADA